MDINDVKKVPQKNANSQSQIREMAKTLEIGSSVIVLLCPRSIDD